VLAAARDLLTHRGLQALTMRALAERLDVAPNTLYSHVANKTALIDDLLDEVLAEVQAPTPDIEDPTVGLHQLMASAYDVLLVHPDLVPVYLARQGARGPHAQRLGDITIALLRRAGVVEPAAAEALRVLIIYTIGSAAFASRPPLATGTEHRLNPDESAANFANGLRWLLAGIVQDPTQVRR